MTSYNAVVEQLRRTFRSGKTKSLQFRKNQLLKLRELITENSDELCDAIKRDINRCKSEAYCYELEFVLNEIKTCLSSLGAWAKPRKVKRHLLQMLDSAYIVPDPLGVALIIAPWNYPVQLTLIPLVGALAAGNCVVLKPSELAPNTAELLKNLVPKYLDQETVRVVTGGKDVVVELLNERFDHIFYTGNPVVAKHIMATAAKNLTPVTLELGGKCPVIITDDCDIATAAKRIAWGKYMSCGQTCLAPDYVLCSESIKPKLIEGMKNYVLSAYGEDPQKSADYSRIINKHHFERLMRLKDFGGQIVYGGKCDAGDLYIEPTIIDNVSRNDPVMQDEIFGPLFPIITVNGLDEAIEFVNDGEKPLALYIFSNDKAVIQRVLHETSSGGVTINDVIFHIALDTLPFGGVGNSGTGRYHGKFSFDTFSHEKAVLERSQGGEKILWMRYPPYDDSKFAWAKFISTKRALPDFLVIGYALIFLIGLLIGAKLL